MDNLKQAVGVKVILKPVVKDTVDLKKKGGIIIVPDSVETSQYGEVISKGTLCMEVLVGDIVMFPKHSPEVKVEGVRYIHMKEEDIILIASSMKGAV